MAADSVKTIRRLVEQLERRIRTQRAIEGFVTGGTAALLLVLLFLVMLKTTWIDASVMLTGSLIAAVIPLALAVWGWTRPLDKVALAQKLDKAHNLHDRLSTALSLDAKGDKSAFVQAQIEDALRHLDVVKVAPAAPFKRPADLIPLALVVAFVGGALFMPGFNHKGELPAEIVIKHDAVLDDSTLALERDRLEALKRELEGVNDPEARELVEEIEKLLDAVENRELSERQFLEKLDEIEDKFFQEEKSAEQVADALKKAAEELEKEAGKDLEKSPEMKELVDALKEKDMDKASDALGKLADTLSDKNLSEEDVERLASLMEKFADKIDPTNPALKKLYEKNKEAFDKLAEKFADKENLTDQEKQRLDRAKEKMEQAEKAQSEAEKAESARRLKQLKREYESLSERAEKVVQGGKKGGEREANSEDKATDDADYADEAGRKAKELQEEAKKDGQKQKSENAKAKVREQLDELREAMKRSGSQGEQNGGQDQRAEKMKEFLDRAKGKQQEVAKGESKKPGDQGQKGQQAKEGDPSRLENAQSGEAKGSGAKEGQFDGENEKGTNKEAQDETNYAGKGKGSRELGEETDLEGKRRDEKVEGQLGEGASKSEIIKDASERGFATTQYKDVYVDYEEVVEEVMEKEKVPSGYRYYVKRYFQLIKPQEQ